MQKGGRYRDELDAVLETPNTEAFLHNSHLQHHADRVWHQSLYILRYRHNLRYACGRKPHQRPHIEHPSHLHGCILLHAGMDRTQDNVHFIWSWIWYSGYDSWHSCLLQNLLIVASYFFSSYLCCLQYLWILRSASFHDRRDIAF